MVKAYAFSQNAIIGCKVIKQIKTCEKPKN